MRLVCIVALSCVLGNMAAAEEIFFVDTLDGTISYQVFAADVDTGERRLVAETAPRPTQNGEGVFNPETREYGYIAIGPDPGSTVYAWVNVDTGASRTIPMTEQDASTAHYAQEIPLSASDARVDEAFAAIDATNAAVDSFESELDGLSARTDELEARISDNAEGVAMAIAMDTPDFVGDERFGAKVNWGQFQDNHAFALSAAGVLGRNLFGSTNRLTVDVGIAIGGRGTVGTRAGGQLTW